MASLQTRPPDSKDPSKKIYVVWYNPARKTKQRKVTKYFNTRTGWIDARRWLKIFESKLIDAKFTNSFFPYRSTTEVFSFAFKKFLMNRVLKKSSIESYTYASNKWIELIGDKGLNQYTKTDGITFIKKMKLPVDKTMAENTISSYSKQLNIIWQWFISEGLAKDNPIKTVPRQRTQIKIIPDAHLKIIFEHFRKQNKMHYQFVRFTYLTGFRPSTSLALKTDGVKLDDGLIIYPNVKESKESLFPIHESLAKLLKEMDLQPGHKLFPWHDRKLVFFSRAMGKIRNELKLGPTEFQYNLKMLRKNLGTLAANNISLFAAQSILDHSDSQTTLDHYAARPLIDQLRKDINEKISFLN
jgi:integrase